MAKKLRTSEMMKRIWIGGILLLGIGFIVCGESPAVLGEETSQSLEQPLVSVVSEAEEIELAESPQTSVIPEVKELEPVGESQAYQEYLKRSPNDFSKMICLLNYFRTAPAMVQFEGSEYTTEFAYPFGLVYLMTNYRGEKPAHWARKHCYRSIFTNKVIYLKFQDGSTRPARDVILEKFEELEEADKKRASRV